MGPENHSAYDIRVEKERKRVLKRTPGKARAIGDLLPSLFDGDVATEATDLGGPHAELHAEEAEAIRGAHPNRVREFRAGRHCARAVLERLGIADVPVLRGKDRAPIWPPSITGSLTHTARRERGFCAAVGAFTTKYRALGLDAEFDEPLGKALWRLVLLPNERSFVEGQTEPMRGRLAKLIFSAKECVYKCQYTVTREFLEFSDVAIDLDLAKQSFHGRFQRSVGDFAAGTALEGRYLALDGLFVTATSLRA